MDLEKICRATGIPVATLATTLFPAHHYPQHALRYAAKSKNGLTKRQNVLLTEITGRTLVELEQIEKDLTMPEASTATEKGWSWRPDALKSAFYKGKWRADYYPATNVAYLFKEGELVSDHILVAQTITLRQFIADMEELIGKY